MIAGRLVWALDCSRWAIADKDGQIVHPGLHCGECLEVAMDGEWTPTRMEMQGTRWYMEGTPYRENLRGLAVRMEG